MDTLEAVEYDFGVRFCPSCWVKSGHRQGHQASVRSHRSRTGFVQKLVSDKGIKGSILFNSIFGVWVKESWTSELLRNICIRWLWTRIRFRKSSFHCGKIVQSWLKTAQQLYLHRNSLQYKIDNGKNWQDCSWKNWLIWPLCYQLILPDIILKFCAGCTELFIFWSPCHRNVKRFHL